MATFLKNADQVLTLDAVTAGTYSLPSVTSHAGIKLLVHGQWIPPDAARPPGQVLRTAPATVSNRAAAVYIRGAPRAEPRMAC